MDKKKEMVTCPHCGGKTVCDCVDCGKKMADNKLFPNKPYYAAGICKICNGLGKIPKEKVNG